MKYMRKAVYMLSLLAAVFFAACSNDSSSSSDGSSSTAVTAITISAAGSATAVAIDGTLSITAAVTPSDATDSTVSWTVSAGDDVETESVATYAVSDDTLTLTLTGVAEGSVTVQATANDDSGVTSNTLTIAVSEDVEEDEVTLTYAGTEDTTPSIVSGVVTDLTTGAYLAYPLTILDSSVTSASISGTINWTSASDKAGVGFISYADGMYSDAEVNHYFIGGAGGVKGNGGSSYDNAIATGTDYTFTVSYDSTSTSSMYTFTFTPESGSASTKSFKSTQIPWSSTDYVYLAVGGSADNVTISNVTVTVNGTSIGEATAVTTLPEDTRTALTASGAASYELTADVYSTSNLGDSASITLSNVSLESLSVSPSVDGTWSWDDTTVTFDGSTNPTATASFIPDDRSSYSAVLSWSVEIAITDSREEASATTQNFTITYFDTSDSDLSTYAEAAAGTTTGSDYVTLTSAVTTYNSIYDTLSESWSSSTGATFALTNSSGTYSATSSGADILSVAYTITAGAYDVTLKAISFEGSQSATNNVHVDVRYGSTTIGSTDDGKSYSVSALELNKTISAGESATVYLVFALKSGQTLSKAISPILKDVVINCSVETGYVVGIQFANGTTDITLSYDSDTAIFTATAPDEDDSYTFSWYFDDDDVSESATTSANVSTWTVTASDLTTGVHVLYVEALEASTGITYSASYHVTVSDSE